MTDAVVYLLRLFFVGFGRIVITDSCGSVPYFYIGDIDGTCDWTKPCK